MQTDPVDLVLSRLKNVRRAGAGWMANCPTRRDSNPSLSIKRGDDGRCLLKDFGGSTAREVVEALGLTMGDLFADEPRGKDWRDMVQTKQRRSYAKPDPLPDPRMTKMGADFLAARKIPLSAVKKVGGYTDKHPFGPERLPALCFPYTKGGEVVNVKYRALTTKDFRMVLDAQLVFWNIDGVPDDATEVIVVEGEMDGLALMACGHENVISPPNGCQSITEDVMESGAHLLKRDGVRVLLAGDMDPKGEEMMEDIAHRVGRERCFRVRWPDGCKDANDTLVAHGEDAVRRCVAEATPLPVNGIITIEEISGNLWKLYEGGQGPGLSTGWKALDEFYTVLPGYWTVVTGQPGLGKTTFLNALSAHLARLHGWSFGICSLETRDTARHAALLASNYVGKPFREGFLERMTTAELCEAEEWIKAHYAFIQPAVPTMENILAGAAALVYRTGAKGIVVDPWNRIYHPESMNSGDYIAGALNQIGEFAHRYMVHVWLVAHPTKLPRGSDGKYPVPTLNQIAGSYQFEAMADNGISLGRDKDDPNNITEFHLLKYRPEEVGKYGIARLAFHRPTGRYYDLNARVGATGAGDEWRPPVSRYIGEADDSWDGEVRESPEFDDEALASSYTAADGGD